MIRPARMPQPNAGKVRLKVGRHDLRSKGFYKSDAEPAIRRAKVPGGWLVVVLLWAVTDVEHRTYA
jgi:hypothetical protein